MLAERDEACVLDNALAALRARKCDEGALQRLHLSIGVGGRIEEQSARKRIVAAANGEGGGRKGACALRVAHLQNLDLAIVRMRDGSGPDKTDRVRIGGDGGDQSLA